MVSFDFLLTGWVAFWKSVGTVLPWLQSKVSSAFGFSSILLVLAGKRELRLRKGGYESQNMIKDEQAPIV